MAYDFALETEAGEVRDRVADAKGQILSLIYETSAEDISCPRLVDFIDPDGDTTFNRLQMTKLDVEFAELYRLSVQDETRKLISEVRELIRQCAEGVHLYLRVYGD